MVGEPAPPGPHAVPGADGPADDARHYQRQLRRLRVLIALYHRRMQRRLAVVAPPRDEDAGPQIPPARPTDPTKD